VDIYLFTSQTIRGIMTDPAAILEMSKKDLVELYANVLHNQEDIEATIKAIKDELVERMDTNGEIVGNYSLVKAKRINFKIDLEKAKELGAVKPAIDNSVLKKLFDKGVKIPHEVTSYLLIKAVSKKE